MTPLLNPMFSKKQQRFGTNDLQRHLKDTCCHHVCPMCREFSQLGTQLVDMGRNNVSVSTSIFYPNIVDEICSICLFPLNIKRNSHFQHIDETQCNNQTHMFGEKKN